MNKLVTRVGAMLFAVAGMLTGCGDSDCALSTQSLAHFEFESSTTHKPLKWNVPLTISKTVSYNNEVKTDTIINKEPGLSHLSLPLSYTSKTTYTIHYNEKMQDVIEVTHKNIPYVTDLECGTMMFYQVEDLKYTTNALDSVVLVNPDINNEEKKNFTIYYTINE